MKESRNDPCISIAVYAKIAPHDSPGPRLPSLHSRQMHLDPLVPRHSRSLRRRHRFGAMTATTNSIRSARTTAIILRLKEKGSPRYLSGLYGDLRYFGWSRAQLERAVDDAANAGLVTVLTDNYGAVVVKLREPRRAP